MKHEITVDPNKLNQKPSSREVGIIKSRFIETEVDCVRDFIDVVGLGVSWSGGTFKGNHLSNKNFIQSSVIGLDFDQGFTPQEAIDRIQKYDISPNCWYPSFSDDPNGKRKFRLVFFLDRSITDVNAHRALMNLFCKLYPECDKAATDASRFFYGSNQPGMVLSGQEITLDDLYTALSSHAIQGGRLRENGRNTKGGRKLYYNVMAVSAINIYNRKHSRDKIALSRYQRLKKNLQKNVGWDKLARRVQLFDQFISGTERLKYSQLEFIATNLAWMKGARSIYRQRLQEFNANYRGTDPDGKYPHDGRFELLRDFRQRNKQFETCMFPMNLDNPKAMAPEADKQFKNLIEAERDQIRGVRIIGPINRMPLRKAEQLFAYTFSQVMESMDTDIHIFKVHTALGKTESNKEAGPNTLLCFPTHDLKREVFDRRSSQHTAICTPQAPIFEDEELNQRLGRLWDLGFHKKAYQLIVEVSRQTVMNFNTRTDQKTAEDYLKRQREIRVTDKTILTTHDWAVHSAEKLNQIDCQIFDEDPIHSFTPQGVIHISDLTKMCRKTGIGMFRRDDVDLLDVVNYLIKEVDEGQITSLPDRFNLDLSDQAESFSRLEGVSSDVVNFLKSAFIYKEEGNPDKVHFIKQYFLPENRKIVIMSASPIVHFWKEIYGSRVKVHDISQIHPKGEVKQYLGKSYSRQSLKASTDEAKALQDGSPVITFMKQKRHFKDADSQTHFGNCSGYDHLKGTDIKVIGTPHQHNSRYYLLAAILGIPIKHSSNKEFGRKNVEYDGLEFNFSTFLNNDRLSKIQMDLICAELQQAVGRCRHLREDATCKLYSNFPLRIAAPNFHY